MHEAGARCADPGFGGRVASARVALQIAEALASSQQVPVRTDHLLLALLSLSDARAGHAFASAGVDRERLLPAAAAAGSDHVAGD